MDLKTQVGDLEISTYHPHVELTEGHDVPFHTEARRDDGSYDHSYYRRYGAELEAVAGHQGAVERAKREGA